MSLTHERLVELLAYDPETGTFTWRFSRRGISGGKIAGVVSKAIGYRYVCIDKKHLLAHRLAWFYITGEWPSGEIDHINGIRADNRWLNLRKATRTQQLVNTRLRSDNKSGYKGVVFHPQTGKWRTRIKRHGKIEELGLHLTPEAAHAVYLAAAHRVFGEFARGG